MIRGFFSSSPSGRRLGGGVSLALLLAATLLMLADCGKKGPPAPPGPPDKVTYPRTYPAY